MKHGCAPSARRWGWVFALALVPFAERVARADEAPAGADDCVSFETHLVDRAVTVNAKNACKEKLSCNVNYTVRCSSRDGTSSSASKQQSFKLPGKSEKSLSLSAAECQSSWDIDPINWSCS